MTLSVTTLDHNYDNVDRTAYTSVSIAPAINSLVLVFTSPRKAATIAEPTTVSGAGLTLSRVNSIKNLTSTAVCLTLHSANVQALSSGILTFDFGGVSQLGCLWSVLQVTSSNGKIPIIVQNNTYTNDLTSSSLVSLNPFSNPNNIALGSCVNNVNEVQSLGSGFITLQGDNGANPVSSMLTEWAINDPTIDTSWVTAGIAAALGVGIQEDTSYKGLTLLGAGR